MTLMSGDGEIFEVEAAAVAALSVTIRHAIEEGFGDRPIPLPIVGARALALAVEYCRKHHSLGGGAGEDSAAYDDELRAFDHNLAKVDRDTLFDLIEVSFWYIVPFIDLFFEDSVECIRCTIHGGRRVCRRGLYESAFRPFLFF